MKGQKIINTDKIFVRDYVLELEIGAFTEERGAKQRLSFTVVVDVSGADASKDDVDAILSYDEIIIAIQASANEQRLDLLEALAESIAARILTHDQTKRVNVVIEKLDRIDGRLGVEVCRSSGDATSQGLGTHAPDYIVCLPDGFLGDLSLFGLRGSALFVVGGEANSGSNKRVSLLASEQAAWLLSEANGGMDVIASRTELEYAARQGSHAIWAPSKIVFDSFSDEAEIPIEIGELALWLAGFLGSKKVVFVDRGSPESTNFEGKIELRSTH